MKIYQWYPRLGGAASSWAPHMDRAAAMGFDAWYVNPLARVGASRSLYSLADAASVDPAWAGGGAATPAQAEAEVRAAFAAARARGLKPMVDLVLNHTAVDAPLIAQHPEWYAWENGAPANPGCVEEGGHRVAWTDLAQLDWTRTRDPEGLHRWAAGVIEYWARLGAVGFRCDAAYQLPAPAWRRLIREARTQRPELVFAAETLGCSPADTLETARAGFHYVFNSAKWWDFESAWLMEQYQLTRETCDSIAFPESHDTPRLAEEGRGHEPLLKQRYLFAALFSAGVLMPVGFEFGFRKRLHVVETRPEDWETPSLDLTDFIRRVNAVKGAHRVFREDGPLQLLSSPNPQVLLLWKSSRDGRQQAVIALNKDAWNYQTFYTEDPVRLFQSGGPVRCVSPENPLEFVSVPFHYGLRPGEAVVLVAGDPPDAAG